MGKMLNKNVPVLWLLSLRVIGYRILWLIALELRSLDHLIRGFCDELGIEVPL